MKGDFFSTVLTNFEDSNATRETSVLKGSFVITGFSKTSLLFAVTTFILPVMCISNRREV